MTFANLTDTRFGEEKWFEAHMHALSSTDAAALQGRVKWRTPLDVWYRLVLGHKSEFSGNAFTEWGNLQENNTTRLLAERTGFRLRRSDRLAVLPDQPLICTPDGFVRDPLNPADIGILELKAPAAWMADEWEEGVAPEHYIDQVKFHLLVTGLRWGVLAALVPPSRADSDLLATVHVEIDDDERQELLDFYLGWHQRHVVREEQPPARAADQALLRAKYGEAAARTVLDESGDLADLVRLQAEAKELEKQVEERRARLMQRMGEAMFAADEDGNAVTWKPRKDGKRVFRIAKSLPKEAPEPELLNDGRRDDDA